MDVAIAPAASRRIVSRDRLAHRKLLLDAGIAVPPAIDARDVGAARAAVRLFGGPAVLKARRQDEGRRARLVRDEHAVDAVFADLGGEVLVEPVLPSTAEVSVLVDRRPSGGAVAEVPAGLPAALEHEARELAMRVADLVGAEGVLAVELLVFEGILVVNDLAAGPARR